MVGRTRQPFLGLAFAAGIGIIAADYSPTVNLLVPAIAVVGLIAALSFPFSPLFFAVVAASFFCLHSTRISHTPAQALADAAGIEARPVSVVGTVVTEPKVESNGVAVFLLQLHQAKIGEKAFIGRRVTILVRWRRAPTIGDELALFGTLQPIEPPRNPGEFDMRAYLARRGVTRTLIVRYAENGQILQSGSEFSVLRAAARSREWMQRTLSRGIEDSPDVLLDLRHRARAPS